MDTKLSSSPKRVFLGNCLLLQRHLLRRPLFYRGDKICHFLKKAWGNWSSKMAIFKWRCSTKMFSLIFYLATTLPLLKKIFKGVALFLCWQNTLKSLKRALEKVGIEKEERSFLAEEFLKLLRKNKEKGSLKKVGLKNGFFGFLKKIWRTLGRSRKNST